MLNGFGRNVLVTMDDKIKENTGKVTDEPNDHKKNIIVAGGSETNSVEMFNWRQRKWSPLQSMPEDREGATSFIYNNHIIIAGGDCGLLDIVDDMIRMNIDPNPDLSKDWNDCPVALPDNLANHSCVLYNDQLIVSGGYNRNGQSDLIKSVQLFPPYAVKTLSRMPEQRQDHGMELFDDELLIVGGSTTGNCKRRLSSVLLYNMKKNELKQLSPLPYEVSDMATVKWGDSIIVIGGIGKKAKSLDTVVMYNVKTEEICMLPSMNCERWGCAAVVIENNIVVLGGRGEQGQLKSVEGFNFERYCWEGLPEMSEARCVHTAVVV